MKIAFGTDENLPLTEAIKEHLLASGHEINDLAAGLTWPDVGRSVGVAVASGEADMGVVCCWTGTGVSMAANKVPGVRAALCGDLETAIGARKWNDANVLAMSLRLTSNQVAKEMLDGFMNTEPDSTELPEIAKLD